MICEKCGRPAQTLFQLAQNIASEVAPNDPEMERKIVAFFAGKSAAKELEFDL